MRFAVPLSLVPNLLTEDPQGASPKEQIVEACRRDNVELFQVVLGGLKSQVPEKVADFFNTARDVMGNYLLHVCAMYGSCTHHFPPNE
jgi:hypothetical protein